MVRQTIFVFLFSLLLIGTPSTTVLAQGLGPTFSSSSFTHSPSLFVHQNPVGYGVLAHPYNNDTGLFDKPFDLGSGFSLSFEGADCIFSDEVDGSFELGITSRYRLSDSFDLELSIGGRTSGHWSDDPFDTGAGAGVGCFLGGSFRF